MKNFRFLLPVLLILLFGCQTASDSNQVLEDIQENLEYGNLSTVNQIVDSLRKTKEVNPEVLHIADSIDQIADRIRLDFSLSEDKFNHQIGDSFTVEDISEFTRERWIEWKIIDGEKKYFNRAASNLLLLKKFYEEKNTSLNKKESEPGDTLILNHTTRVVKNAGSLSNQVKMKVTYTITVNPDAVPAGEVIRCWLPYPKTGYPQQNEVKLLSTSDPKYIIAPDSSIHSSIYMEGLSAKSSPTIFHVSYNFTSYARYFDISKVLPYDRSSYIYQKYTMEQLPHICFNDNIKHLADSITGGEIDPTIIVRKLYTWFKDNIPWAGALEYSIMPNIPEYVLRNKRGDCGMQTFLLMSMLRYKGVPVRWQSGWMMTPEGKNLHDWSEVYYEGTGWVPVDVSKDLLNSKNNSIRYFYLSGIDAYRLIINDGIAGPLHPEKKFLRSEPYDFQRGEAEWKGGNLYFDKWDYDMKIEYLPSTL
jgi:hypothetical protein